MKIKYIVCAFLVLILGSSFTANMFQKHILVKGEIVTPKWWQPNGSLQLYVYHQNNDIESIVLKGTCLFSKKKEIKISELDSLNPTQISFGDSMDQLFTIHIDKDFNHDGGTLYATITNYLGDKDEYIVEIISYENSFEITRQQVHSEDSTHTERKIFDELNITLNKQYNIDSYEILPE
ncbi:MAG: hypothetical protein MRY57_01025 [Candidatus Pacebacteria bacterium]|nr:hypothetical protein [Candidatus Paceibacterota bacterium]